MRNQLLRLVQRLPAGSGAEYFQAVRAFSNAASSDAGSLLSGLQGKKEEGGQGFKMPMLNKPGQLSFASQLHSLSQSEEQQQKVTQVTPTNASEAPKSLMALPPRGQRGMATAAHGHDDLNHFKDFHPYHILPGSPWPALSGLGATAGCLSMVDFFHAVPGGQAVFVLTMANIALTMGSWWRDCMIENELGMHTAVVQKNLVNGLWIFIASEAMLFVGLLWACVDLGLTPSVALQMQWPPVGIHAIGYEGRALVMSAVLAASYYSANVAMVAREPKAVVAAMATTIGLGGLFLADMYLEYATAPFTITDSPYGTTFFVTTGFHGMHVALGSIWLTAALASYMRTKSTNGPGFKGSVLYWHFVDVVWIAVYGIIYVAGL